MIKCALCQGRSAIRNDALLVVDYLAHGVKIFFVSGDDFPEYQMPENLRNKNAGQFITEAHIRLIIWARL